MVCQVIDAAALAARQEAILDDAVVDSVEPDGRGRRRLVGEKEADAPAADGPGGGLNPPRPPDGRGTD